MGGLSPLEYAYCCACATLCIEMAQERLFDLLPGRTDMLMDWAFLWSFPKGAPDGRELTPRIPHIFPPPPVWAVQRCLKKAGGLAPRRELARPSILIPPTPRISVCLYRPV